MRLKLVPYGVVAVLMMTACNPNLPVTNPSKETVQEIPIDTSAIVPTPDTLDLATLKLIIPRGFEIVYASTGPVISRGELNGDSFPDIALLLEHAGGNQGSAAFMIAQGSADGMYQYIQQSGFLGPEPLDEPDPAFLKIQDGLVHFHFQAVMWSGDYTFRWDKDNTMYCLIASATESSGPPNLGGGRKDSTDYLTGKRTTWIFPPKGQGKPSSMEKSKVSTKRIALNAFDEKFIYGE